MKFFEVLISFIIIIIDILYFVFFYQNLFIHISIFIIIISNTLKLFWLILHLRIVIFNRFVRIVRILSIKSSLTQISLYTAKIFFFTDIQHLASMSQRVKTQKENCVIMLHLHTKLLNRWRERYNYVK